MTQQLSGLGFLIKNLIISLTTTITTTILLQFHTRNKTTKILSAVTVTATVQ